MNDCFFKEVISLEQIEIPSEHLKTQRRSVPRPNDVFHTRVYGKWILAGEHTVLRGGSALVFPVFQKFVEFTYKWTPLFFDFSTFDAQEAGASGELSVEFTGEQSSEWEVVFWAALEKALGLIGRTRSHVGGNLRVDSHLPVGAGLGASAALCVGIARLFTYLGWLNSSEQFEFARNLENVFHGESSGADIAASSLGQGILFERNQAPKPLKMTWTPKWYLTYSGRRGITAECVAKVKDLLASQPQRMAQIDELMRQSVAMATRALAGPKESGIQLLAEAICQAARCFEAWGLMDENLVKERDRLHNAGALASKPTGSGNGGFVLSLWSTEPPTDGLGQMINLGS